MSMVLSCAVVHLYFVTKIKAVEKLYSNIREEQRYIITQPYNQPARKWNMRRADDQPTWSANNDSSCMLFDWAPVTSPSDVWTTYSLQPCLLSAPRWSLCSYDAYVLEVWPRLLKNTRTWNANGWQGNYCIFSIQYNAVGVGSDRVIALKNIWVKYAPARVSIILNHFVTINCIAFNKTLVPPEQNCSDERWWWMARSHSIVKVADNANCVI